MLRCETNVLEYSGLPLEMIKRSFTTITIDNKPFNVRTFVIGDYTDEKPTLVMTHGAMRSSLSLNRMLKPLSKKYRLVIFDQMSWGFNTRLQGCSGIESAEAAENWMREWILKTINALDVPDKFYLYGHSIGAWLVSQYASQCPERIEALFLSSPLGMCDYDEETYPGLA